MSLALLLLSCGLSSLTPAAMCQEQKLPEPESIGAFYYFDSNNNSLTALQKQIAVSKKRGLIKEEIVVQIQGEKASLRLKSGQKMEFVVSVPNGVDPNKYQLISFEVKKGKREAVLAEGTWTGSKANPVFHPYTVSRFGNAYKITPSQNIPPGEYAFSPNDSNDTFCFGVDANEENTDKK
jgi:hypothetical protein